MYILDEEKIIKNGVYEGYLDNDDVNQLSILIYTDKRLNGTKLSNYSVVKVGDKTKIRVNGSNGTIYISYEYEGEEVRVPTKPEPPKKREEEIPGMDYIKAELFKKSDKINTFTKREILAKLESVEGGSTDYNDLENKPSIQSVELEGDKTFEELGIVSINNDEISNLL